MLAPRALAEEDAAAGGPGSVAEAAGEAGRGLYARGAYADSGLPSTDAYLTRRAGMFPDVVERLALEHLGRGDQLSALITAEWCARPLASFFRRMRAVGLPKSMRGDGR